MILNRMVAEVFPEYCDVQKIAKETMEYIKTEIRAGMPLSEVRRLCEEKMTMLIENGNVVKSVSEIVNDEWRDGLLMEKKLHDKLNETADPQTTFEDLYFKINKYINDMGYINLDFMGNLGHSIVK